MFHTNSNYVIFCHQNFEPQYLFFRVTCCFVSYCFVFVLFHFVLFCFGLVWFCLLVMPVCLFVCLLCLLCLLACLLCLFACLFACVVFNCISQKLIYTVQSERLFTQSTSDADFLLPPDLVFIDSMFTLVYLISFGYDI